MLLAAWRQPITSHAACRFRLPGVLLRSVRLDPAARLPHQRCLHVYRNNAVLRVATLDRIAKLIKGTFQLLLSDAVSFSGVRRSRSPPQAVHPGAGPSAFLWAPLKTRLAGSWATQKGFSSVRQAQNMVASRSALLQAIGRNTNGFAKPRFSTHQASLPPDVQSDIMRLL